MKTNKFHTRYNPPKSEPSPSGGVSLTETQYLKDCDIEVLYNRYCGGDRSMVRKATYGDFTDGLMAPPEPVEETPAESATVEETPAAETSVEETPAETATAGIAEAAC